MTPASEPIRAGVGRPRGRGWAGGLVLSFVFLSGAVHADTDPQKRIAAQALFDEARRLVDGGRTAEACPKFQESQALDPGIGTLYNLGTCLQTLGRTASAWAAFREAADMARIAGQSDREIAARKRADALEPRLMRLQIEVPIGARAEGLELRLDAIPVGEGQWGVPMPVDPGEHTVSASAPGKVDRAWKVALATEGATRAVRLDPLEDEAVPPSPPPTVPPAEQPPPPSTPPGAAFVTDEQEPVEPVDSDQRMWGYVVGGAGVVGVGLGAILALGAKSKYDDSLDHCDTADPNRCNDEGVSLRDDARSQGNIATVAFGLGAAALVGGAVLVITAPDSQDPMAARLETGPLVGDGSAAWMMRGTW